MFLVISLFLFWSLDLPHPYLSIVIRPPTSFVGLKDVIINISDMHELAQLGSRLSDMHCNDLLIRAEKVP